MEPDGSVLDDQLGDLVGPEHVPVQPLHVAVHNCQVFYLAPSSKKKKVIEEEGEEEEKHKKIQKPSEADGHAGKVGVLTEHCNALDMEPFYTLCVKILVVVLLNMIFKYDE